jgi:hypothetical protein
VVSSSRDLPTTHRYDGATPTKKLSGLPPLGCFSLFFMGNARRPEALSRRPSRSGFGQGGVPCNNKRCIGWTTIP